MSKIEWTNITWNPITGCNKKSEGCLNCYAEKMHKRLKAMGIFISGLQELWNKQIAREEK